MPRSGGPVSAPPNIVLILADTLVGANSAATRGALRGAPTPRMRPRWPRQGLRCLNFNVESDDACRHVSALMTGRHPIRSRAPCSRARPVCRKACPLGNHARQLLQNRACDSLFRQVHSWRRSGRLRMSGLTNGYGHSAGPPTKACSPYAGLRPGGCPLPYVMEGRRGEPCAELHVLIWKRVASLFDSD